MNVRENHNPRPRLVRNQHGGTLLITVMAISTLLFTLSFHLITQVIQTIRSQARVSNYTEMQVLMEDTTLILQQAFELGKAGAGHCPAATVETTMASFTLCLPNAFICSGNQPNRCLSTDLSQLTLDLSPTRGWPTLLRKMVATLDSTIKDATPPTPTTLPLNSSPSPLLPEAHAAPAMQSPQRLQLLAGIRTRFTTPNCSANPAPALCRSCDAPGATCARLRICPPWRGACSSQDEYYTQAVLLNPRGNSLKVSVSNQHICSLMLDGSVKCFGNNAYGQLGLGHTNSIGDNPGEMGAALQAVDLGGRKALELALGFESTCALLDDHSVRCWGNTEIIPGSTQNIGDNPGEMGAALAAIPVPPGEDVAQLAGNSFAYCMRFASGKVQCWGRNLNKLYYNSTARTDIPNDKTIVQVNLGTNRTAKHVAIGGFHVCFVLDNDQVKCAGQNPHGTLGTGDSLDYGGFSTANPGDHRPIGGNLPWPAVNLGIGPGESLVTVFAGDMNTCAVISTGRAKCWGTNRERELGFTGANQIGDDPSLMGAAWPELPTNPDHEVLHIAISELSICALLSNRTIHCFGAGLPAGGQVMDFGGVGVLDIDGLDAGGGFCATLSNFQLTCWSQIPGHQVMDGYYYDLTVASVSAMPSGTLNWHVPDIFPFVNTGF